MRLWALLLLLGALAPAAAFHAELREAHSGAASRFARRNFGMAREGTVELKYTITTQVRDPWAAAAAVVAWARR